MSERSRRASTPSVAPSTAMWDTSEYIAAAYVLSIPATYVFQGWTLSRALLARALPGDRSKEIADAVGLGDLFTTQPSAPRERECD
jgi:hypothetical protein